MGISMAIPPARLTLPPFAFVGVTVLPMDGGPALPGHTVVVQAGRIAAVGPAAQVPVPADATVLDGSGKVLMPGLCDMHVHTAAGMITDVGTGDDVLTRDRFRDVAGVFLDHGVTTVRNMAGTPAHLVLRDAVAAGEVAGPRIVTGGPILETRFTWPGLAAIGRLVTSPEEARIAVRDIQREGYDFIKVYNDIDASIYDALVAESRAAGLQIVGHVAFEKGLHGALAARQDSIEHLRAYDFAADTRPGAPGRRFEGWLHTTPQRLAELADQTAAAGVWNVPTLVVEGGQEPDPLPVDLPGWLHASLTEQRAGDASAAFFTPEQREAIRLGRPQRMAMVAALDRAGAGLLPGSDCPIGGLTPGGSLLRELELLVECGVSPRRVLEAATIRAAEFLGVAKQVGSVTPGKIADLLLVTANPDDDIGNVRKQVGVMAAGVWRPVPGAFKGI